MTAHNFLDLKEHWAAVIDLIGECARARDFEDHERIRASNFIVVGISQEEKRIVAKEGSGSVPLFVLNQSQCHFVPLLRNGPNEETVRFCKENMRLRMLKAYW